MREEIQAGTQAEATGTLAQAIAETRRLLDENPALAAEQAQEILKVVPRHPPALLLLAIARQRLGDATAALQMLEQLVGEQPNWTEAHFEYAKALTAFNRGDEAIAALRRMLALKSDHPEAWRLLADHLMAIGDTSAADVAYARHIQCSSLNPSMRQAAAAMVANDIPIAERLLKERLKQVPTDVAAIRMLAEVAVRVGRNEDAQALLERCLELAPGFSGARYNYAMLLHRLNQSEAALAQIEQLLAEDPRRPSYRNLIAVILSRIGEYERSSQYYSDLLAEYPENAKVWLSYAHVLKTEGRREGCEKAYRRAIERNPSFGEAYWSLANLKTFRFEDPELAAMRQQLERDDLDLASRVQFHFALGKATEDAGEHAESFHHYDLGNSLHRRESEFNADKNSRRADRLIRNYSAELFRQREGAGCPSDRPIFIVGMPRSGSTLLEQILSSHSEVEGTTELPEMITMAKELREQSGVAGVAAYSDVLAAMDAAQLSTLGEQYLERTRIHRKTERPRFIDKMPNNFLHVGMIHLVLPNAKIIDARRHPLGCCFSNYKQYFARGQAFSYGLNEVGRFYYDYVRLMAHYDSVLPGRVHRVIYEDMVEDTESEVRRLLDYCGLPFEESCLRFFENKRPVRTASSEQVRQPIYRQAMEQWRHYDPWLAPLKSALGPVLEAYPEVPGF